MRPMTEPALYQHQLPNGLWLVAEPMDGVQSLGMSMLLPAGAAVEPEDQLGVGQVLAEMIARGAGSLDARAHSNALDALGVDRDTNLGARHLRLSARLIGRNLRQALPLLLDMVRRPMLPEAALGPAKDLAIQAIDALDDEPHQKVFLRLRERHYPAPIGRNTLGDREHIARLDIDAVRRHWGRTFVPGGSILAFAGRVDWPDLKAQVEDLLGDWQGVMAEPAESRAADRGYHHEQAESTQVHIGVAYDGPTETDPRSILARAGVAVLSGGMSGRLFTEVRERRGLVYSVFASYAGDKRHGAVLSYAGTTAPRAQETLDVLVAELRRISAGVSDDEFSRAIVGMKSHLVMHGESTAARAMAIAADQYVYGRPRSLGEVTSQIDAITLDALNRFLHDHPPGDMTIVTVGPQDLRPSVG